MPEARLIESRRVPLEDIRIGDRLRPINEHGVAVIVASIEKSGVMQSDVQLRRVKVKGEEQLHLIAGGHRMAAARRLGWEDIPAKIYECSARMARLMEVDDNLANAELSIQEVAIFAAEQEALHLELFPQSARGKAGAAARWEDATEIVSFASLLAEKRGISERHARSLISIGKRLEKSTIASIANANLRLKDLTALAEIEGEDQVKAASQLVHHGARDVADALRKVRGEPSPVKANAQDAAYVKLMEAWGRAPTAARRQFLNQLHREHPGLMAEEALRAEKDRDA